MALTESRGRGSRVFGARVLAIALAVVSLAGCDGRDATGPATQQPTVTAAPVATDASVVIAPGQGADPGVFDDGIADSDLPGLAPRRAADYPAAHLMEDSVWEKVDAHWALALYGSSAADPTAGTYIYLMSPEGVSFEVMQVPEDYAVRADLRSWRSSEGTAMIVFDEDASQYDTQWGGVELDLRTGAADTVRIKIGSQTSASEDLRAIADDGTELWLAQQGTESRFLIWSPTTGWRTIAKGIDGLSLPEKGGLSPDASRVLFDFSALSSAEVGIPSPVIYALEPDAAAVSVAAPNFPAGAEHCDVFAWIDADSLEAMCTESGELSYWQVALDNGAAPVKMPDGQTEYEARRDQASFAFDGAPFDFISEQGTTNAFEVQFSGADGLPPAILSTDDYLLRSGLSIDEAPAEVEPGAYRLLGTNWAGTYHAEVFGFDTHTGYLTPYSPGRYLDTGYAPAPHSLIFFGESRADFADPNLGG